MERHSTGSSPNRIGDISLDDDSDRIQREQRQTFGEFRRREQRQQQIYIQIRLEQVQTLREQRQEEIQRQQQQTFGEPRRERLQTFGEYLRDQRREEIQREQQRTLGELQREQRQQDEDLHRLQHEWEEYLSNRQEAREYLHNRREALGRFQREQQEAQENFHREQREALVNFHRQYQEQVELFQRILQVELDNFRRERQERGDGDPVHDNAVQDATEQTIVFRRELTIVQDTHQGVLEGSQRSHQGNLLHFQEEQRADLDNLYPFRHIQLGEPINDPGVDEFISSLPIIDPESLPAEDRECIICREPYMRTDASDQNANEEIVRLPCQGRHVLGIDCLKRFWAQFRFGFVTCPLCRERFVVRGGNVADWERERDGRDGQDGQDGHLW